MARQELEERQLDERCGDDPIFWLQHHTKTENERHLEQGLPFRQGFPNKQYFSILMKYMMTEKRLFIAKSREMMVSWLAMGRAVHEAQWRPGSLVLIQTEKEHKVTKPGKCRNTIRRFASDASARPWKRLLNPVVRPTHVLPLVSTTPPSRPLLLHEIERPIAITVMASPRNRRFSDTRGNTGQPSALESGPP